LSSLNQGSPTALISGALTITILGFVETQLINKKYASKHQYTISANRELVALGCCSFFGSFFGAYSAFGSIPRTKGQWSHTACIAHLSSSLLPHLL
jgi:MFS superfamily sulfate permease-like transporter